MVKYQIMMKRAKNFWSIYRRSRKGIIGLGILIVFILVAILAPYIAPYDPLKDRTLAGTRAKPVWLVKLTGANYSLNIFPVEDPDFCNQESIKQWTVETSTPGWETLVEWTKERGFGNETIPGCMLIKFTKTGTSEEKPSIMLYKEIDYPYSGYPARFKIYLATKLQSEGGRATVKVFIERLNDGEKFYLWEERVTPQRGWVEFKHADSWSSQMKIKIFKDVLVDPAQIIFNNPGKYRIGIEAQLYPEDYRIFNLYIDDYDIKLYGTAFGLLGTDHFGRDLFSQLIWGSRVSLFVGLMAAFVGVVIGLIVGLVSGYLGGMVDEILMRFADMLLVIPFLPLVLVLIAVLGSSIWNLVILLGLLGWMSFSRIIRSQVLSLKERAFVEAARAAGAGAGHIILRHLLPNVLSLVYVNLALTVPTIITVEAALSWLGLGDPNTMTWGMMLHNLQYWGAYKDWWWVLPPGICISLLSLSFVLIGYAIDEIVNPRLRKR